LAVPKPSKKLRVISNRKARRKTAQKKEPKSSTALVPRSSATIEHVSPEDQAAFTQTLIESGEAARLDKDGKLPAGATHKIVEDQAGKVKVVRRRFSITE
jgi:hypothetical protein